MEKKDKSLLILLVGGVGAFFAYYLYNKITDPDNAPSLSELWDTVQSYGVRGWLIVRGKVEQALKKAGANADAKTIAAGLIASEEGFSSKAYPDPEGQTETYSIAYGHQIVEGDGYSRDSVVSEPEGFSLLLSDLDSKAACVDAVVTSQISENQRAALYSFTYNEGCHAFETSTLLVKVNNGDFPGAAAEFARWIYVTVNGVKVVSDDLKARRLDERDLFNS